MRKAINGALSLMLSVALTLSGSTSARAQEAPGSGESPATDERTAEAPEPITCGEGALIFFGGLFGIAFAFGLVTGGWEKVARGCNYDIHRNLPIHEDDNLRPVP